MGLLKRFRLWRQRRAFRRLDPRWQALMRLIGDAPRDHQPPPEPDVPFGTHPLD